jgi:hypothetical protein
MLFTNNNVNDVNDVNNINNTNDAKANNDQSKKKKDYVSTLVSIELSDL